MEILIGIIGILLGAISAMVMHGIYDRYVVGRTEEKKEAENPFFKRMWIKTGKEATPEAGEGLKSNGGNLIGVVGKVEEVKYPVSDFMVRKCYKKIINIDGVDMSVSEAHVYNCFRVGPKTKWMNTVQISNKSKYSMATSNRALRSLCEKGLLKFKQRGKSYFYSVAMKSEDAQQIPLPQESVNE